jgi:small GTP-binding protein
MGNCNCLSTTNSNKNADTSVGQLVNEHKSNQTVTVLNTSHEKRGASIPTQSFVKQSPTTGKKEYLNKNASIILENGGLNDYKFYSRFINRREINIVVMGESNTGKSSFVIRYVSGKFEPYHVVSVCNEYYQKKGVNYNGKKYDFNFTVSAGKSEYKEDILKTCQDVDFFLLFYDITSKQSFDSLKSVYNDIKGYMFNYKDSNSNVILVGNKNDLHKEKSVHVEDVKKFLQNDKICVLEISVKNNTNITKVFNQILENFDAIANSSN